MINLFCLAQIPRLVISSFRINFRPRASLKDGGVKEKMMESVYSLARWQVP